MSTLGERIKYARESKELLQSDLAKLVGVKSSAVISNWEKDINKPNADKIVELCNVLDISLSFLLDYYGKSSNDVTSSEFSLIKKYRFISERSPDGAKVVDTVLDREYSIATQLKSHRENFLIQEKIATALRIRLINYYYRLASAGTGQIIFDMPPTKRIEIPDIPEYKKADYAIGVNGNSMEPIYHDGDTLLIEMTEEIERGEIGIFMVDSESYVKKLGDGELISLNPEYDNIKLTENSKCMGKVIAKL